MLHLFYNAVPREANILNATRRHCNNEDNYGNRQAGNRGLIRSEQAYYLEKKKFQFIHLKVNDNNSGQYLFQGERCYAFLYL